MNWISEEMSDSFSRFVEDEFDGYLEMIAILTEIKAPTGHEEKRANFIKEMMIGWGYSSAYVDVVGNVICDFSGGHPKHVFMAHLDTVFDEKIEIKVTRKDGRMYAPGIGDDTTNVSALLFLLKFFAFCDENDKQKILSFLEEKRVMIVFDVCEEGLGNLKGAKGIFNTFGNDIKYCISYDVGYDAVTAVAVGSKRYRISCKTKGGHSFWNFGNENAINELSALINKLYSIDVSMAPGRVTYNVGRIEGGYSVNTIAEKAEMLFEYRADSIDGLLWMDERFYNITDEFCKDKELIIELLGERPSMGSPDKSKMDAMIHLAKKAIHECSGRKCLVISGSTDCNIPLSMDIPAISFGTYLGGGVHTTAEYVETGSLKAGLMILWTTFLGTAVLE